MLDKVKNYLIIPLASSDDDDLLITLIDAAKSKLAASGVDSNKCNNAHLEPLYDLAVCMIVCHWYEHRDEQDNTPKGVIGVINQLRYCGGGD